MIRILVAFAFVIVSVPAAARPVQPEGDVAVRLEEALSAAAEHDRFYGAVLLARDGEVVLRKAYGPIDEAGTRATTGQPYNVGSVGKLFTMALVLERVEDGTLSLDDTIARHLPNSGLPGAQDITIRQLLSHSSGYGDYFSHPDYTLEQRTLDDFLDLVRTSKVEFAPGKGFAYSNSAFWVLAAILEATDAQDRDWQTIFAEDVFDRAGMEVREFQPDMEYAARPKGFALRPDGTVETTFDDPRPGPDGGWYTGVDDMLAFDRGLGHGFWFGTALREESERPLTYFPSLGADVGLVWEIYDENGRTYVTKGGTTTGGGAELVNFRHGKANYTLVMLSNLENAPLNIFRDVLAYALGDEGASLPGPAPLVAFYRAATQSRLPGASELKAWAERHGVTVRPMPMLMAANALRKKENYDAARSLLDLTLTEYPDNAVAKQLLAALPE
ncbi:serine hydrolase domain-containing protein [Novosphingobium malaysiense]|uniref:serine hydrolase domain-containing protein n=1 Tax=Novosphingobium malaysiense TaxID=1348853 RepID=UPI0012E0574F|nr:serine hydrolase domain-containing protein [Novosphingobium malaysiense]